MYYHPYGRTITEADNTWFTLLTMNINEMHFNEDYAKQTELGRILVNSTLTLAVVSLKVFVCCYYLSMPFANIMPSIVCLVSLIFSPI